MTTNNEIIKLILTGLLFIVIDFLYLSSVSSYFNNIVKGIQGSPLVLNMTATILCYISLVLGLYYFIIRENKTVIDAIIIGLFVYSVFEFTNKAIFTNWKWHTVIIDSLWGGVLFGLTTYFVYKIYGIK
jgi:uncharacterized membrane protein